MRYYEIPLCIQSEIPYQGIATITKKFKELLGKCSGKIIKEEYWGVRNLAYPIKKNRKGRYYFMIIEASVEFPKLIKNYLDLNESILRFGLYQVKTPILKDSPILEGARKNAKETYSDDKQFASLFSNSGRGSSKYDKMSHDSGSADDDGDND